MQKSSEKYSRLSALFVYFIVDINSMSLYIIIFISRNL